MKKRDRIAKKREKMLDLAHRRFVKRYGEPVVFDWNKASKLFKAYYAPFAESLFRYHDSLYPFGGSTQDFCGKVFNKKIPTTKE